MDRITMSLHFTAVISQVQSKAICDQRFMPKDHLAENTLCRGRETNFQCIMDEIQCPLCLENWKVWRKISQWLKAVCLLIFLRSSMNGSGLKSQAMTWIGRETNVTVTENKARYI